MLQPYASTSPSQLPYPHHPSTHPPLIVFVSLSIDTYPPLPGDTDTQMAGFNGRRVPNVSQYIANLNTIPSAQDVANPRDDNFRLDDDLAVFTNAEFFDFDLSEGAAGIEQGPINYDPSQEERARRENAAAHKNNSHKLEFVNGLFLLFFCIFFVVFGSLGWDSDTRINRDREPPNHCPS